jgi:hypothetical protein
MVEIIVNQQLIVHDGDDHGGAAVAMAEELIDHNHLHHLDICSINEDNKVATAQGTPIRGEGR